jgi:spore coat polysaccharide biosynthesis protein SpsF
MNSTRLPGKVLLELKGKPVIHHIIQRVSASRHIGTIAVATTISPLDDPLVEYLKSNEQVDIFRGSENDVLARYYLCAKQSPCDLIVRVTADDPLKDAIVIDEAIARMLRDPGLDYCSNTLKPTYPEGLDVEVFKFSALEKAYEDAKLPSEREHVTPYIWKNPAAFKLANFEYQEDLSAWRWTLDKPADMEFITAIYDQFYRGDSRFSFRDVIDFLKRNPALLDINSGTKRNEGYFRSLERETNQ